MNFEDFRTMPRSFYSVDISWKFLEQHVQSEIDECGLDLTPDFQREHVWTPKQQKEYLEYIFKGGCSGKELFFNCPEYPHVSLNKEDKDNKYVIVDGRQRLTAVRLFFKDKIRVFGHLYSEIDGPLDFLYKFRWNIAALPTRAEVLQWYLDFNAGGTPHSAKEIRRVRDLLAKEAEWTLSNA